MTVGKRAPVHSDNPETSPYFDALFEKRIIVRRCTDCSRLHYYPRTLCPFCFGETEWVECTGEGSVYSFSVMRRVEQPYAIAYVTLKEGVTVLTNIVNADFDRLRIGDRVRPVFEANRDGRPLLKFAPE